jgi:hypothetical protein
MECDDHQMHCAVAGNTGAGRTATLTQFRNRPVPNWLDLTVLIRNQLLQIASLQATLKDRCGCGRYDISNCRSGGETKLP